MSQRTPIVTTHALRRYGERTLGVEGLDDDDPTAIGQLEDLYDFDPVAAEAAIIAIVRRGMIVGAMAVTFGGLRFVLRDGVVVTAAPKEGWRRKRRRRVARNGE
jgi:hypothetical protein